MTGEGTLIAGRYRLQGEVGRGAMGVVWRARDERLDRAVAVKQLKPDTDQPAARALREAQLAARLRHPHAVTVHDIVGQDDTLYLVMEYLPSRSLADLLLDRETLPARDVATIGGQLASALAAAHGEGIVHRDVTPGNVLITSSGVAKIADFGIAHARGQGTITGGGIIAGTPAYLAPEVANGGAAGYPADVFSLGATLYHALEGTPPFGTDDNPIVVLMRAAHHQVAPLRHTGPLADALARMLHREPAQRPTMAEVQDLLDAVLDNRPLPPPRPHTPKAATRLIRVRPSRRRLATAGVVGAVLLALGVVIGIALAPRADPVVTAGPAPAHAKVAPTTPAAGCTVRYDVTNSWPGGYQVQVTVRNTSRTSLSGWQVSWTLPGGHHIEGLWNGSWTVRGSAVTVDSATWNAHLDAASMTTFGLIAATPPTASPTRPTLTCHTM
ncbi:MAG TPA: protein kinase [Pseudonocardiaceae bacterium]|nr:protein kinase [Pseudonocardiaceae bacterium]